MPIDYSEYHPKWSLISRLIRFKRAENRCEICGILNYSIINKKDRSSLSPDQWNEFFKLEEHVDKAYALRMMLLTEIILTVAHLDHDKNNNRFNNLKALCQKCHLKHDITHHTYNRKYGRKAKYNNLKLF